MIGARRLIILNTILLSLWSSGWARATTDYEIKAAYLYNFVKFVQWERSAHALSPELNLCILGRHPFRDVLAPLNQRKVQNRTIHIRYLDDERQMMECHVLFVSYSERKQLDDILSLADQAKALTVSDIRGFVRDGGIIGFVTVGNVIRFEVNLVSARASEIHLSSKLLELAEEVVK